MGPRTSSGTPTDSPSPVAVVLPGIGYTAKAPLLYWSVAILRQSGWRVEVVEWTESDLAASDPRGAVDERVRMVEAAVGGSVDLVVAKSFGTLALPWAVGRGVAGVWLTPVLSEATVLEALTRASSSHLAVGGDADPMWQPALGLDTDARLVSVEGGDHGLLVDDWVDSYAAHRSVLLAVEAHLGLQG